MLQHVAPDIIAAVNRFFGYAAIAGVRMTHGQIARAAPVHQPAMLKPVPAELGDSLRDIGDPELRTVLERSEEHTSELQSLMRNSYAALCLKNNTCILYNAINTQQI